MRRQSQQDGQGQEEPWRITRLDREAFLEMQEDAHPLLGKMVVDFPSDDEDLNEGTSPPSAPQDRLAK